MLKVLLKSCDNCTECCCAATELLADLVKSDAEFTRDHEDAIENIEFFEQERFEAWRDEVMQQLDDPDKPLALQMKGQLMETDYR